MVLITKGIILNWNMSYTCLSNALIAVISILPENILQLYQKQLHYCSSFVHNVHVHHVCSLMCKVKEEKLASWKKLSAVSQMSPNPETMEVQMQRSHHLNDEDDTEVDKENVAQGIEWNYVKLYSVKINIYRLYMWTLCWICVQCVCIHLYLLKALCLVEFSGIFRAEICFWNKHKPVWYLIRHHVNMLLVMVMPVAFWLPGYYGHNNDFWQENIFFS